MMPKTMPQCGDRGVGLDAEAIYCQWTGEIMDLDTKEAGEWDSLREHIGELCDRYAKELGENAYAVFNAITEFASHPPTNHYVRRERHSLQRMAGAWLHSFSEQCRRPDFHLASYIGELTTGAWPG